jgi:hypothetical protein
VLLFPLSYYKLQIIQATLIIFNIATLKGRSTLL